MLGEELSRALSDISDDKIEEAAGIVPTSRKHIWLRVVAAAAVLVLVMTWLLWPGNPDAPEDDGVIKAPGMLKVYAYDLSSGEDIEDCKSFVLEEGDETKHIGWWDPSVGRATIGLPIRLELDDQYFAEHEVVFDVKLEYGNFRDKRKQSLGKQFTVKSGETIYWTKYEQGTTDRTMGEATYVDITIKADGHIVGYTVIKIVRLRPEFSIYTAYLVKNVTFPLYEGEFQQITEEYVIEQMEKAR